MNNLSVINKNSNIQTINGINFGNNNVFPSALTNHPIKDTYTSSNQNKNDGMSTKSKILIGLGIIAAGVLAFFYFKKGKVKNVLPTNTPTPTPTPTVPAGTTPVPKAPTVQPAPITANPAVPKPIQPKPVISPAESKLTAYENLKKHIAYKDDVVFDNWDTNIVCYKDGKPFTGKLIGSGRIRRFKDGIECAVYNLNNENEVKFVRRFSGSPRKWDTHGETVKRKDLSKPLKLDKKIFDAPKTKTCVIDGVSWSDITEEKTLSNGNILRTFDAKRNGKTIFTFDKDDTLLQRISYHVNTPDIKQQPYWSIWKGIAYDSKGVMADGKVPTKVTTLRLICDKNGKWKKVPDDLTDNNKILEWVKENGWCGSLMPNRPYPKLPSFFTQHTDWNCKL